MESMWTDLLFAFMRDYSHRFVSTEKTSPQSCWGFKKAFWSSRMTCLCQNNDHENQYYLRLLPESGYRDGLWECASGSLLGAAGIWPVDFEECPRSSKGLACGWKETQGSAEGSPALSGPASSDPEVLWLPADCYNNLYRHGVVVTAEENNVWESNSMQEKKNHINTSNSGEFYFPYCDTLPNKKANRLSCICS